MKQEEVKAHLVTQPSFNTAEEQGHAIKQSKSKTNVTQKMIHAGSPMVLKREKQITAFVIFSDWDKRCKMQSSYDTRRVRTGVERRRSVLESATS